MFAFSCQAIQESKDYEFPIRTVTVSGRQKEWR